MDKKEKKKDSPLKFYAKYSSLAMQMILMMVAFAFGGHLLDNWLELGFPVFTFVLTIVGVVGATFYGMREFFKQNNSK